MDLAKQIELLEDQNRLIEKMYKRDIAALQEQLRQVERERDMWKKRSEDMSRRDKTETTRIAKQLRHV